MKNYLNYSGLAVIPHRGGMQEAPENTINSFEYSQAIGCNYIETDVQLSSDHVPYIFHDDNFERILGMDKSINSFSSEQIDKLKIFKNFNVPRLDETLKKFPDLKFQIDFKTDEVVVPALNVIMENNAQDRVCIASFSSKRLKIVRDLYPELCISMGPKEVFKALLASFGLYKKKIPGDCLQVSIYYYGIKLVTKRLIKWVHKNNLKIMVWTINDRNTFKKLIKLNVDGIITDKPMDLIKTLEAKNQ
tara:strand:- start:5357 stop:6097 length:741 start_codon:yes stop_codon:yes gene_type:complete